MRGAPGDRRPYRDRRTKPRRGGLEGQGYCPVDVPLAGPLALIGLLADPTPAWLAIPGLLLLAAGVMVFAALHVRKLEINYSE